MSKEKVGSALKELQDIRRPNAEALSTMNRDPDAMNSVLAFYGNCLSFVSSERYKSLGSSQVIKLNREVSAILDEGEHLVSTIEDAGNRSKLQTFLLRTSRVINGILLENVVAGQETGKSVIEEIAQQLGRNLNETSVPAFNPRLHTPGKKPQTGPTERRRNLGDIEEL